MTATRTRRIALRCAAACAVLLIGDQVVQLTALRDGWLLGRRIAPFDPPVFMPAQQDTLARLAQQAQEGAPDFGDIAFDAELGWTLPPKAAWVDWCGGRIGREPVPESKPAGVTRIAAFGCSFTYGSEVEASDAWPAQLDALRDDVQVLNLGVPGFGVDQALLRCRRVLARSGADEVWLGFLPSTALRALSMYHPALRHYATTVATKPRFVLGSDGGLGLVANPARSIPELVALLGDQQRFARAVQLDAFVARWPAAYAPNGTHWSHWFASARLLLTVLERGGRDVDARLADPDDECRMLTRALIETMRHDVERAGARFRVVILPDHDGLAARTRDGRASWDALVEELRARGVTVTDTSDALIDAGALRDAALWAPNGHYAAAANAVVARALDAALRGS